MGLRSGAYTDVLLAVWLLASAFMWRTDPAHFANALAVAVVTFAGTLVAISVPAARYVIAAAGGWLAISVLAMPRVTTAAAVNSIVVGLLLVVTSLITIPRHQVAPGHARPRRRRARR
jgi:hypothetical protein